MNIVNRKSNVEMLMYLKLFYDSIFHRYMVSTAIKAMRLCGRPYFGSWFKS